MLTGFLPSLLGHAIAYRWHSLPRVRRHRASKPQGSSERVLPWQVTMDQLICASLSHTHYWYEVGMLKVPAVCMYLCIYGYHLHCSRLWTNRVKVANPARGLTRENTSFLLYPFAHDNLISRDRFDRPVLQQPAQSPHSGCISCSGEIFPMCPFAPENLISRDRFDRLFLRRPAQSPHSG